MRTLSILGSNAARKLLLIAFAITAPAFSALAQERASIPEPAKAVTIPLAAPVPVQASTPSTTGSTDTQKDGGFAKQSGAVTKEPENLVGHIA